MSRGSGSSYNLRSFLQLMIYRYRFPSGNVSDDGQTSSSTLTNLGHGYGMHQGLQYLISGTNINYNSTTGGRRTWKNLDDMVKDEKVTQPTPTPPGFNFSVWGRWVVGFVLSILLPFWKQDWDNLKRIEGEAEVVMEEVENVAEVVEKVAAMAETVAAGVAVNLPENGKLKETALLVERVSKATAHDAHVTQDFIHKVDALKHDIGDLETMFEPVVDKIIKQKYGGN